MSRLCALLLALAAATHAKVDVEGLSASEVLQKYKDLLPTQRGLSTPKEEIPDHKGDPIWLHKHLKVLSKGMHMYENAKGAIGYASAFEEETGRYILDFQEVVGPVELGKDGKRWALHPVNLEPVGEGKEKAPQLMKKKDEL